MAKKTKKKTATPKKALPSMIEDLAQWLRNEIKEKGASTKIEARQGVTMSNTVEQIAFMLRKKAQRVSKKSTRTHTKKSEGCKRRHALQVKRKTKAKN